jgi:hypothetical protein
MVVRLFRYWRERRQARYLQNQLTILRHLYSPAIHRDWYEQNPWARTLRHGDLYATLLKSDDTGKPDYANRRCFRVLLEFDADDLKAWEERTKTIPEIRYMDAFDHPLKWQWLIEELQQEKDGGLHLPLTVLPDSRTALTREVYQSLVRLDTWS